MKLIKFGNSLYWRISGMFVVILILLSLIYIYISLFTAEMYFQEASQRLNNKVAQHIAGETKYFVNGEVNQEELEKLFHDVMVINPSIEVYLLDPSGNILNYYAPNRHIKLKNIHLEPIKEFINDTTASFHMGVDPRNPEGEKVFSAASIMDEGILQGFIYVILNGEEYQNATHFLLGSYIMRIGLRSMSITLIAAALLSLFLLGFITRNLRKIVNVIREFKNGNLNARIHLKGQGELTEFADAFNEMADTILNNIEEIKTMDNLRRELVANVSHDLRTPLAVIQGYIETILIKSDRLTENDRKEYMETILSSTERLKKLVEELFELSKLEARQTVPNPEPFSITELIQDIHQKNLVIAKSKNIELVLDYNYNIPYAFADIGMMEKVIQNLLDNALKFTPANKKITIQLKKQPAPLFSSRPDATKKHNDFIRVSVSDTGVGISSDELAFIFERYQRTRRIGLTDNDGLGLGLAIVKKILEVHDTEIEVKSIKGEGTSFSFLVPVYQGKIERAYETV